MATVQRVNTSEFFDNSLTSEDSTILSSEVVNSLFNTAEDTVELYIYNYSKELEESNPNYTDWKLPNDGVKQGTVETSDIVLDPEQASGAYNTQNNRVYVIYNFVNNKLNSSSENQFFISSINSDRTEVELQNNNILDEVLEQGVFNLQQEIQTSEYFIPLYLNFGEGPKYIAINVRLNKQSTPYKVQLKLYEPLPNTIQVKSECWIQTLIADSNGYEVVYDDVIEVESDLEKLRGPNFNIDIAKRVSNSTEYKSKLELNQTNLTGSRSQLSSLLEEKGVELNIDYTNYSNFVHFSSATQRLENFYYKVSLIEGYQNDINAITGSSAPIAQQSQSISSIQADIDRIITNFDGYDYYLYYESGSKAWPKTNSVKPYTLASTGSAEVIAWYGTEGLDGTGQLQSASIYDNGNQDNLVYSTPEFIREDSDNAGYDLFIEMIGQHFDNLYLYTEAITQKYNADNRLDFGVSKDLVADTLRSFGVKLYENNFSTDDLYTALIGLTPSGSTLPLPNISTNFPVTGSGIEYIETIVSASNEVIPLDDLNKSVYKRLYHNLPALVKKKGTLAGLRLLINTYGIPDTILRISEFGGKDKDNSNDWDYWKNVYSEKFELNGTDDFTFTEWALNTDWNAENDRPAGLAFRFKTDEITTSNPTNVSQSLWWTSTAPPAFTTKYSAITLEYTGSAGTSGPYSGSVVDPYYRYGTLTFFPDYADTTVSASIYLPFFDGGWWSVLVNSGSDGTYTLYAKNSLYNGDTGTELGFQASSSISHSSNTWISGTYSVFGNSVDTYSNLSGSLQELRYYKNAISESVFDDYVMNPNSIEGNSINSSTNELVFRGALGAELYTESISIHPKVSGEAITASFASDSNIVFNTGSFTSNKEYYFLDQPAVGIKNRISDKIRLDNNNAYGTVLSNQRSLIQNTPATKKYTRDTNYLEVGFSPQNEINDDIINQIGYFNIGDYIGDPRQISSSLTSYEDLDALRLDYFKKYSKSYDLNDYLRLVKFYDNSLFKMVKDFIPARTGAATGAIIKPTILERNRQRPAQASWTRPEYSASIQPQSRGYETGSIEVFTGGTGGNLIVPQGGTETVFSSGSLIFATGLYSYFYKLLNNATNEPYTYTISFDVPSGYSDGSLMLFDATSIVGTPSYTPVLFSASMADITGTSQKFTVEAQNGVAISYFFDSSTYLDLGKLKVTHELYDPAQGFPTSSINGLLGPVNIPFDTTPYYQGDFPGTTIDVVNNKLQDNPLLGETYKYSIADLQDIDVTVSQDLLIEILFVETASIPFDTDALNSPKYNTTTFTYSPEFSNIVDYSLTLQGTFSCSMAGTSGPQSLIADLSINGTTGSYPTTLFTVDSSGPTLDFSGSFTQSILVSQDSLLELGEFKVVIYEGTGSSIFAPLTASFQDSRWTVLTENLAAQSTYYLDPTVFTQQNFPGNLERFNDYNAIYNNVYSNRVSNKYFDVDYTNGVLNPSNFGPIISQSALYAQIQDSNYDSKSAFFEARFGGTKNTGEYNFTELIAPQSIIADYPIDYFTPFFAYFDWVGGANPQYPGGGNVHCLYLINAETGDILTLSQENKYLDSMSQIFKKGDLVYMLPISASTTDKIFSSIIVEGGSLYNTIYYNTGSTAGVSLGVDWENDALSYYSSQTRFTGSGTYTVLEEENPGWLYPLLTGSDPNLGNIKSMKASNSGYLFNKRTGEYYNTSINSGVVLWEDTYLPLQYGDFIRFGSNVGDITGSLDYNFDGLSLNRIVSFTAVSASGGNTLQIAPEVNTPVRTLFDSPNNNNQNFRIFRRIPDEMFVLTDSLTYTGAGLLIPKNFNPKYDPIKIAKEQNII